jgi:IS30 family transposase
MDEHPGGPGRHLTGNPWSAGCAETRLSGAEGGPGKRAGSNPATAPRSDPYIIGKGCKSAVGTLVERSTRFVLLLHLPGGRDAHLVEQAMRQAITALPAELARTITWDQGKEMAYHAGFTIATGIPVYFCDPHAPWQRGSNENTNGLLRQYLPKGTDLSVHSAGDLARIAASLNNRPRKTLGFHETIREARRASCAHRLKPPFPRSDVCRHADLGHSSAAQQPMPNYRSTI